VEKYRRYSTTIRKNKPMTNLFRSLQPLLLMALAVLTILTLSRLFLVSHWWQRVEQQDALSFILLQGARFDAVLIGMLLIIPCLLLPLLATSSLILPGWKWLLTVYIPLVIATVLFMELATPSFADQFDARPNILFFEYLEHPREVLSTLWGAYRLPMLLGLPIVAAVAWFVLRHVRHAVADIQAVPFLVALPMGLLLALVCGAAIRSTTDHRPINPATVAQTSDALVNELPLNSTYTTAYAAYEMRYEETGGARYGKMDEQTATAIVRQEMHIEPNRFKDDGLTTWHSFESSITHAKPKNLVIILEESLGAEFVGSLGGLDLTPNLDALASEGLWFEQLYATGTRSVRGIEAVITGFLPTASRSVVKLSKSQRDFFTLASFLSDKGYTSSFIYGGEAHFDNMRRFFMGNGFDHVVDEKDYADPVFTGSWGVSDEDLMARAHEEFTLASANDQPFFSLVFSSSNHTPFEFPDGRIELHDTEKQTVNNAVKYADHAIGEFFAKARTSSYWDDTVFLIVADHNSRVYGDSLIPVDRFHIPGLILGGGIEASRYQKIASQIDLAPTLLSIMGLSGEHPMPGRDLTALPDDVPGRAIMQFNAIQAYMEEDTVAVLMHDLEPIALRYDNGKLHKLPKIDPALAQKAIAHATWAANAYQLSRYRAVHSPAAIADD